MALNHPHFFDTISNSDDQFGEDLANLDWNMSNIDPTLDNFSFQNHPHSQPPMSFQVQQQVQQQRAPEQQHHRQQMQHPTMQRFVNEQERQFFTTPNVPRDILQGVLPHTSIPTSSLPRASHHRMASPSLSHDLTSTSGSAESPPAEQDYYPEAGYYGTTDNQFYRQPLQDIQGGPASYHAYSLPQHHGFSCVSMDQVQGFVDTDDGYFEHEEDFGDVAMKNEYAVDVDHHHSQASMKISGESQAYRYPSDEGIGASIQDEASPKNTILVDDSHVSDIDAEGDMDDLDAEHIPSTPASDTEYTPKSTRTRKRRPTSPTSKTTPPSTKRNRISKTPLKTKGQVTCKSCSHAPFKDATSLQRHTASAHTRAYVCVFHFAGCASTFASKNEWKRHVSSQHLNLTAWVCELGSCGGHHSKAGHSITNSNPNSNTNGAITRGSEFNRKDLFTQHLRRMHVPLPVKRKKAGTDAAWEEEIKTLQQTCLKTKRQAPTRLVCPVCGMHFEGLGCWDDRMEHVGKHLEAQAQGKCVVRQGDDQLLLQWALREGIVERKSMGGYRLVLGGAGGAGRKARNEVDVDEEDAECEDE